MEEIKDIAKKPLTGMTQEEADHQLRTMVEAARITNTSIAIERSKNISELKDVLQLLTHYEETKKNIDELPSAVSPEEVEEPKLREVALESPVEPEKKNGGAAWMILLLILGVALYVTCKFSLIPGFSYIAHLISIPVGSYVITEVDIASAALIMLGIVVSAVISSKNRNAYELAMEEYENAMAEYKTEAAGVSAENIRIKNEYSEAVKKAEAEAEEKNKLVNLKRMSYQTTLKHLEADYMKKYSRTIPGGKLSIEYIKSLIHILESEQANTISEAVAIEASAKSE